MVKYLITLLMLLTTTKSFAQEDSKISLESWIDDNVGKQKYKYSLIVLKSEFGADEAPVFAGPEDVKKIDELSYFRVADTSSIGWDLIINKVKLENEGSTSLLEKLTRANYYLFAPESGDVVFATRNGKGKIEELFSLKTKDPNNWMGIFGWIQKKFGWDGVVLAAKANQYVVGAPKALLKTENIQALAIADSSKKEVLSDDKRSGSGLLSLVKMYNGFGLFEAVFVDEKNGIEPGTKFIIERRKK